MNYFILTLLLFLYGCSTDSNILSDADVEKHNPLENSVTKVHSMVVVEKLFNYYIECKGHLEAVTMEQVILQNDGMIESLNIRNGQWVREGRLIMKLNGEKLQLAFEKAEVQLKEKKLEYENQLLGFQLNEDTNSSNIKDNLKYISGLALAELNLKEAKFNLENSFIMAPVSGVVANLERKEGNWINKGEVICNIYDNRNFIMESQILESDIKRLKIGHKVEIRPLASPDKIYPGKVFEINPSVDENGMVQVKLLLDETKDLLPGMHSSATIEVPQDKSIVVPKEAVIIRSGKAVVFSEEEGSVKWNYVVTGLDNGKEFQILEGLHADMNIIISNNLQLDHDAKVQIIKKE